MQETNNKHRKKRYTEEQIEKRRKQQSAEWNKKNSIVVSIRLQLKRDAKIIKRLKAVTNKNEYIRNLLLKDIDDGTNSPE